MQNIKKLEDEIRQFQKQYHNDSQLVLRKHNELLKKEVEMLKQNQLELKKQLNAYKKIVFSDSPIDTSQVLQLQHNKIFELQTQLQILQSRYDKLMSKTGSVSQTEYAIKCKQLERQLERNQLQHQKQIVQMRDKLMRKNASEMITQFKDSNGISIKRTITSPQDIISPNRTNKFV